MSIKIFTDGSCNHSHQLRPGGYAGVILEVSGELRVVSGSARNTTSQRMELMAAIAALASFTQRENIELYTDSMYLKRGIEEWLPVWEENKWLTTLGKPVKNRDLWIKLKLLCFAHFVDFKWVKAHSGIPENEYADRLAKEASGIIK